MKLRVWALLGALCGSISVNASEPKVKADIPEIYTVKKKQCQKIVDEKNRNIFLI